MRANRSDQSNQKDELLSPYYSNAGLAAYFAAAAFAESRSFDVSGGSVIQIGDLHAGRVYQLANPGHFFEIDLFNTVGIVVIILVQPACKEDNWNSFCGVTVMVASIINLFRIGGIVHFVV